MTRRATVLATAALLLTAPIMALPSPAVAAPAATSSQASSSEDTAVNLLGNPSFSSADGLAAPIGWTCDDEVSTGEDSPGSEFIQTQPLSDDEAPVVPNQPTAATASARATTAARAASVASATSTSTSDSSETPTWLVGTPTTRSQAGCFQVVPVRRASTYTLSAWVQGGAASLGSDYGSVYAAPSDSPTHLTMTFRTSRTADSVRIRIHGALGGAEYTAMDAALVGPPSRTRRPVRVTNLGLVRQTSRSVRLEWLATAGASRYEVRRDGIGVRTVSGTSAVVPGLTPGSRYVFTVVALDPAGGSAASSPLTASTLPAYADVPGAPEWAEVDTWSNVDGAGLADMYFWQPDRVTDGYFLYLDGVRTGWLFDAPGVIAGLPAGTHTLQLSAINSAGESPLSDPYEIVI